MHRIYGVYLYIAIKETTKTYENENYIKQPNQSKGKRTTPEAC